MNLALVLSACMMVLPISVAAGDSATAAPPYEVQPTDVGDAANTGLFFRFGAGADYRSIYGLPLYSGAFELSVGGQGRELGAFGTLSFALGRTPKGLSAWELMWSGSLISRFNPFYAGGTLRWALLNIHRFSSSDSMQALTVGLQLVAGYELFASEDAALFAELRGGLDMADQDKPGEGRSRAFFPRAAVRTGVRF